mgnify:FL=1
MHFISNLPLGTGDLDDSRELDADDGADARGQRVETCDTHVQRFSSRPFAIPTSYPPCRCMTSILLSPNAWIFGEEDVSKQLRFPHIVVPTELSITLRPPAAARKQNSP